MKKIIFSGGGTLGPVIPLIAVYQELQKQFPNQYEFLWVGVKGGPEKEVVEKYGLPYVTLPEAKLRRYFSWHNFLDIFNFIVAVIKSWRLIKKWQPDLLISAGGFMSVPLHLAAWLQKKTTLVHQQDVMPGLANKIMARLATHITVSLEINVKDFPAKKTLWIGNPVRPGILLGHKEEAIKNFLLDPEVPTVLILGGGTGALSLNKMIIGNIDELVKKCQIIHMLGAGKDVSVPLLKGGKVDSLIKERYHPVKFLNEGMLADVYAVSDVVVARAGFSTMSELAVLGKGKPFISVPIPDSHQEKNARIFWSKAQTPVFFSHQEPVGQLIKQILDLVSNKEDQLYIAHHLTKVMPKDAREKMAYLINGLLSSRV
ncbi:MAG: UDP-N-acetylglucosamine--N-acetylmuramyl-(pentapeptide) pyrophosphoryl-undecaprenol N-acetylglucosamine transferase [Candidatus Magasanikbacteria bacterium]|nr:UDP-N-acetylglucosamine--N-acetylmuramyl-(pentapeptide) pyrophosphoryl-undecaprenol N-acetylglucosamine transferase [Candidatus Magasanikbacteria bacterium]